MWIFKSGSWRRIKPEDWDGVKESGYIIPGKSAYLPEEAWVSGLELLRKLDPPGIWIVRRNGRVINTTCLKAGDVIIK